MDLGLIFGSKPLTPAKKKYCPKKVKLQAVGRQVATKLEMRPAILWETCCRGQPFGRQRDSVRDSGQDLVAARTRLYRPFLPSLKLNLGQA